LSVQSFFCYHRALYGKISAVDQAVAVNHHESVR
jgi:hypothetical protein